MAVGFVASASSGSQASVATFNIGTLGTGARGGIVFVCTHNSATAKDTGVTWNGVAMTLLFSATDTDTEPGVVRAYFLDNVTNGTITVSRTNDAVVTVGYAASISATAGRGLEVAQTITRVSSTQNTDANTSTTGTGASGEVSVDDGSLSGTDSMRFSAFYSGAATPPSQGTNSTALQVLDSTALGSRFVRETTAGQGSRSVGAATGTTDDWALVAVAVRETTKMADAGAATGTGTANNVTTAIIAQAGAATGTGAAHNAVPGVGGSAGAATGTGEAFGISTSITSGAGTASATGEAGAPSPSLTVSAGLASATGQAFDATFEVGAPSVFADAGVATGTGTAFGTSAAITGETGAATSTGAAFGVSGTVVSAAGTASATGSAGAPSPSLTASAGHASATGTAFNATFDVGAATFADAGVATGTGQALNASLAITASAANAVGTGEAFNAVFDVAAAPGTGGGPGKHAVRRLRLGQPPAVVNVTGTVEVVVTAPTATIDAVVNDDEVVLELLADVL